MGSALQRKGGSGWAPRPSGASAADRSIAAHPVENVFDEPPIPEECRGLWLSA